MALHSRQAKLDGMASQVAWLGECMAAPAASAVPDRLTPGPWGKAHPLRMKSAHASNIRLSFMSSFESESGCQRHSI